MQVDYFDGNFPMANRTASGSHWPTFRDKISMSIATTAPPSDNPKQIRTLCKSTHVSYPKRTFQTATQNNINPVRTINGLVQFGRIFCHFGWQLCYRKLCWKFCRSFAKINFVPLTEWVSGPVRHPISSSRLSIFIQWLFHAHRLDERKPSFRREHKLETQIRNI